MAKVRGHEKPWRVLSRKRLYLIFILKVSLVYLLKWLFKKRKQLELARTRRNWKPCALLVQLCGKQSMMGPLKTKNIHGIII